VASFGTKGVSFLQQMQVRDGAVFIARHLGCVQVAALSRGTAKNKISFGFAICHKAVA